MRNGLPNVEWKPLRVPVDTVQSTRRIGYSFMGASLILCSAGAVFEDELRPYTRGWLGLVVMVGVLVLFLVLAVAIRLILDKVRIHLH